MGNQFPVPDRALLRNRMGHFKDSDMNPRKWLRDRKIWRLRIELERKEAELASLTVSVRHMTKGPTWIISELSELKGEVAALKKELEMLVAKP